MATGQPRTRTGCTSCRVRHLKCDEAQPKCSRCERSGNECVRGYNIRFRHGANPSVPPSKGASAGPKCDYDFATDQTWLSTTGNLNFIDETRELQNIYDRDDEEETFQPPKDWDAGSSNFSDDLISPTFPDSSMAAPRPYLPSHIRTYSSTSDTSSGHSAPLPPLGPPVTSSPEKKRKYDASPENLQFSPMSTHSPVLQTGLAHSPHSITHSSPSLSSPNNLVALSPGGADILTGIRRHPSTTSRTDSILSSQSEARSLIYTEHSAFPLKDLQEAELMRHYLDELSPWFDLCNPSRNFQLEVPVLAATCPTLRNAIYAVSSRHMSALGIGNFDQYVSDRYHQECLKHLIPMLGDSAAMMDDSLLAATVILRTLEELDVSLAGTDNQGHLLGTQVFLNTYESSTPASGLRRASFETGLRQEIWIAMVNQRSVQISLDHNYIDRSFSPADDGVWANRAVINCAEVLRFCFGEGDRTIARYNELLAYDLQWMDLRPPSFHPVYYREPNRNIGEVFPQIWLLNTCVVIGHGHHNLSRILLACYNPTVPRIGPGQKVALRKVEIEIRTNILEICAIALSNRKVVPAIFTAAIGVAMCGDRFSDRIDQEALLGVLETTERDHAWPTAGAQRTLKEGWGWEDPLSTVLSHDNNDHEMM